MQCIATSIEAQLAGANREVGCIITTAKHGLYNGHMHISKPRDRYLWGTPEYVRFRTEVAPVLKPVEAPKLELNIPPKAGEEDAPKALLPPPKAGVLLLPNGCAPKAGVDCGVPNAELLAPNAGCCRRRYIGKI